MADGRTSSGQPLLEVSHLYKSYPGVLALHDMSFQLRAGEVHALFGENGAGKSTLISILSGVQKADRGSIILDGESVEFSSVRDARDAGVSAIFQEFSLVPDLTVAENIFLGQELQDARGLRLQDMKRQAKDLLDSFGFDISIDSKIRTLTRAESQMVEIAKGASTNAKVLILDEPTASLSDQEVETLFATIESLKEAGTGIVYVTHRMEELERLADRVTVLRDGRYIATRDKPINRHELIELMTGRVLDEAFPDLTPAPLSKASESALTVNDLTVANSEVAGLTFHCMPGEIVGFAGLVGSGKSSAARALFGLEKIDHGEVKLSHEVLTRLSPKKLLKKGMVYLPSDRKNEGLFMARPLHESVTLPWLAKPQIASGPFVSPSKEKTAATAGLKEVALSPLQPTRPALSFSGGNQQKGLIARALMGDCQVYILDEPTVGVDVGARFSIYEKIVQIAAAGNSVILISSEMSEILHMCHRVYVFREGKINAELTGEDLTEINVISAMMHETDSKVNDL